MSDGLLDEDGYPTDEALQRVIAWPYADTRGLIEFVRGIWNWPQFMTEEGDKLHMSTGGWSGNESIIHALERNVFWLLCWEQSRRGGHYIFDLSRMPKAEKPEA
jgi:hypothetical protein